MAFMTLDRDFDVFCVLVESSSLSMSGREWNLPSGWNFERLHPIEKESKSLVMWARWTVSDVDRAEVMEHVG